MRRGQTCVGQDLISVFQREVAAGTCIEKIIQSPLITVYTQYYIKAIACSFNYLCILILTHRNDNQVKSLYFDCYL